MNCLDCMYSLERLRSQGKTVLNCLTCFAEQTYSRVYKTNISTSLNSYVDFNTWLKIYPREMLWSKNHFWSLELPVNFIFNFEAISLNWRETHCAWIEIKGLITLEFGQINILIIIKFLTHPYLKLRDPLHNTWFEIWQCTGWVDVDPLT